MQMTILHDGVTGYLDTEEGTSTLSNITVKSIRAQRAFLISSDDRVAAFAVDKLARDSGVEDFREALPPEDEDTAVQAVCHMYNRRKPIKADEAAANGTPDGKRGPWRGLTDTLDRYFSGKGAWFAPDLTRAMAQARSEQNDACLFGRYFKVSVRENAEDVWVATVVFQ